MSVHTAEFCAIHVKKMSEVEINHPRSKILPVQLSLPTWRRKIVVPCLGRVDDDHLLLVKTAEMIRSTNVSLMMLIEMGIVRAMTC